MSEIFNLTAQITVNIDEQYDFGSADEASGISSSSVTVTEAAHVGLTDQQEIILSLLPIPTSIMSIFGSVSIIYMACQGRNRRGSTANNTGGASRSMRSLTTGLFLNTSEWTPYTRLLIGMSCTDIIFSISYSLNPFLIPKATSKRVWAMGNDVTCSALGFFTQFTLSTMLFNGMLSFYFVLTSRYGWKNHEIAQRWYLEPMMHAISLGYPFITATAGAVIGVYNEMLVGQGCWVKGYPEGCGEDPGQEPCKSPMIAYIFGGLILILSFLSISCNNVMIYSFVRRQTRAKTRNRATAPSSSSIISNGIVHQGPRRNTSNSGTSRETETFASTSAIVRPRKTAHVAARRLQAHGVRLDESPSSDSSDPDAIDQNIQPTNSRFGDDAIDLKNESKLTEVKEDVEDHYIEVLDAKTMGERIEERMKQRQEDIQELQRQKQQLKRLQLVSSQARLYVGAFFLCNIWPLILRVSESQFHNQEDELEAQLYPLLVLQNALFPMQGFWNLLVYVRPKYLKCRRDYPKESKFWALRRAMYGDRIEPTIECHHQLNEGNRGDGGGNIALSGISQKTGKVVVLRQLIDEEVKDSVDVSGTDNLPAPETRDTIDIVRSTNVPSKDVDNHSSDAKRPEKENLESGSGATRDAGVAKESSRTEASRNASSLRPAWRQTEKESPPVKKDAPHAPIRRLPRDLISDITASVGDFSESSDHDGIEEVGISAPTEPTENTHETQKPKSNESSMPAEGSWVTTKRDGPRSRSGVSSLEMISELSEFSIAEGSETSNRDDDCNSDAVPTISEVASISSSVKRVRFQGEAPLDEPPSYKPSSSTAVRRWNSVGEATDGHPRLNQQHLGPPRVQRRSSPIELEIPFSPGAGLRRWNSTDQPCGDLPQKSKDRPTRCAQRHESPSELAPLESPHGIARLGSTDGQRQPHSAVRRPSPLISALLLPPSLMGMDIEKNQISSSVSLDLSFDRMKAAMAPMPTDAPMQRPSRRTSPIYVQSDCTVQTV